MELIIFAKSYFFDKKNEDCAFFYIKNKESELSVDTHNAFFNLLF